MVYTQYTAKQCMFVVFILGLIYIYDMHVYCFYYEINLMGDELENLRNPDPQGCRFGEEAGGGQSLLI